MKKLFFAPCTLISTCISAQNAAITITLKGKVAANNLSGEELFRKVAEIYG